LTTDDKQRIYRNASYRRKDEEYLYITPSGLRKQHINAELIFKLKFVDDYKTTDEPSYSEK